MSFARKDKNVIMPSKRGCDVGYDIYPFFQQDEWEINPHEISLIPTGLYSQFKSEISVKFFERGSNTKSRLIVMAGLIDSGYTGEWFVALYNTQHKKIMISKLKDDYCETESVYYVPYSKAICQFVILENPTSFGFFDEVALSEILDRETERGSGCLGSSKK